MRNTASKNLARIPVIQYTRIYICICIFIVIPLYIYVLELGGRKGVKGTIRSRKRGKHAQRSCQDARPHAATPQGQNSTHRQAEGNEATKRGRTVQLNGLPVILRSDTVPKPRATSKAANKSARHNGDARGQNQRTECHLHTPMSSKKA